MDDETLENYDSGDLMPNEGSVFQQEEDVERLQEVNAERAMISGAAPLLDVIFEWFDSEIELTDSIDGLDLESEIDLKSQVLARQLLKDKLVGARERLQFMRDEHLK